MSASVHGEGGRPGLRRMLALCLALGLFGVIEEIYIIPAPDTPEPWTPQWLITLDQMVWPVVALLVIAGAAVAGFARGGRAQLWFGLLTLGAFGILVETMNAHVGFPQRRFYSIGAALLGWIVGLSFARLRNADDDRSERLAEAGAAAGLVATYANAGVQKLFSGGLFEIHSLQAHVLTHHFIDDGSPVGTFAYFVAFHPLIATTLALTTVLIQAGSWMFLVGPRARMLWGTLLISFHLGTLVMLHIIYVEATVLLAAWCYPWARIVARLRGAPKPAKRPDDPPVEFGEFTRLACAAMLIVGAAWVVPTPHELDRPNHAPFQYEWPRPAPLPEQDGPRNTVAKLGPLEVGGVLGSWQIESIEITDGEARVNVVRDGLRASFGLAGPAGAAPSGPWSVGDLHIYFSAREGVDATAVEDGGVALREALSAGTQDPGPAVDAWIEVARATLRKPEVVEVP